MRYVPVQDHHVCKDNDFWQSYIMGVIALLDGLTTNSILVT